MRMVFFNCFLEFIDGIVEGRVGAVGVVIACSLNFACRGAPVLADSQGVKDDLRESALGFWSVGEARLGGSAFVLGGYAGPYPWFFPSQKEKYGVMEDVWPPAIDPVENVCVCRSIKDLGREKTWMLPLSIEM